MSIAASTPALVYGAAGEHRIPLRDGRLTICRAFGQTSGSRTFTSAATMQHWRYPAGPVVAAVGPLQTFAGWLGSVGAGALRLLPGLG